MWSNYGENGNTNPIDNGQLVCYFTKNIGIVKMVNYHGHDAWETNIVL